MVLLKQFITSQRSGKIYIFNYKSKSNHQHLGYLLLCYFFWYCCTTEPQISRCAVMDMATVTAMVIALALTIALALAMASDDMVVGWDWDWD